MRKSYYNPKGFYDVAEKIKDDKNYKAESRYRTAIGRYYYFIFLKIRDLILKIDKRPEIQWALNSPRSHAYVRLYLDELAEITNNEDFERISENVGRLHNLRKLADYRTYKKLTDY